jgi:hypothetical protein
MGFRPLGGQVLTDGETHRVSPGKRASEGGGDVPASCAMTRLHLGSRNAKS